eukprot:2868104-Amphidinium_carterae.1
MEQVTSMSQTTIAELQQELLNAESYVTPRRIHINTPDFGAAALSVPTSKPPLCYSMTPGQDAGSSSVIGTPPGLSASPFLTQTSTPMTTSVPKFQSFPYSFSPDPTGSAPDSLTMKTIHPKMTKIPILKIREDKELPIRCGIYYQPFQQGSAIKICGIFKKLYCHLHRLHEPACLLCKDVPREVPVSVKKERTPSEPLSAHTGWSQHSSHNPRQKAIVPMHTTIHKMCATHAHTTCC